MDPTSWITPNRVTLARVLMGSVAVAIYASMGSGTVFQFGCVAVTLTGAAIALDGLDGWLARRMGLTTPIGAQLDVLADRVIENLYFIYFAANGQIPAWIPVIFFVRGALTDFLRGVAARTICSRTNDQEQAELRKNWMLRNKSGIAIVASRFSRGLYAAMKCACFCALGAECTVAHLGHGAESLRVAIHTGVIASVWTTTGFCLLRALPVLWEGRRFFTGLGIEPESETRVANSTELSPRRHPRPAAAAS